MRKALGSSPARLLLDAILMFVFFSLLTSFVEATYIFGLLGTDIPIQIVYVLFLLSPFLLLVFPRLVEARGFMLATGTLGLLFWAASLPLGTGGRMLCTAVGSGLFLLFLASRLRQERRSPAEQGAGLASGVVLSILFRSAHSGSLLLDDGASLAISCLMVCLAIISLFFSSRETTAEQKRQAHEHSSWRSLGITLGLCSSLVLLYFGFTSPAAMARWVAVSYIAVMAVETGALVLFLCAWMAAPGFRRLFSPGLLVAWNVLFLLALAAALRLQQPSFSSGAVYPLYAHAPGLLDKTVFWAMLVLHPVIYADFAFLATALHGERATARGYVRGFAVSSLFLLLLTFAQIFTTVYDYIPVIGPWFRNGFWLIIAIPAALLALSILLVKHDQDRAEGLAVLPPVWLLGIAIVAGSALLVAGLTSARPPATAPGLTEGRNGLRILTYNIQQGQSKTGERSFSEQMEVIRRLRPDVVGLEETDTARIAGGNADLVRFLADGLDMHSYYGPVTVSGTFGVALLSRYPIERPRTFFMPSRGEQTAAIDAWIVVNGKRLHVLVTHLDNDGALPQQRLVLDAAVNGTGDGATAIALGDFNFDPSTEQYRLTTSVLEDAWLASAARTVAPGAPDPARRIDHIFLTKGTPVVASQYLPEGPSDHPALFAEITW
jgi:endonuclease/exonuclease/phosphatase family metal-dependent hydrolase